MTQCRTIACLGAIYVTRIVGSALLIFAAGETVNLVSMCLQARRDA